MCVSNNIETMTGYPAERFVQDSSLWASRLHPDDREWIVTEFNALSEPCVLATGYRWQRNDGEYRWLKDLAILIRRSSRTPQEHIGAWTDVTTQRQATEFIRRQADIIN